MGDTSQVHIDNEAVRVTRWTLRGEQETGQHRHEFDYVVIPLAPGRMSVTAADGTVLVNELVVGQPYFRSAGAHHNVRSDDDGLVDFVEVEIIGPAPPGIT